MQDFCAQMENIAILSGYCQYAFGVRNWRQLRNLFVYVLKSSLIVITAIVTQQLDKS